MDKLAFYMEVNDLGEDEHGNPCPASVKFDFGAMVEKMPSVEELNAENGLKDSFLKKACLDRMFSADDCRFITAEEYEAEYGDREEEEDI